MALAALELSRTGDRAGAITLLREAATNAPLDEAATSLLFTLLGDRGDDIDDGDEQLALCERGLSLAKRPITQSTWHLRRGLLLLQRGDVAALKDLQRVLSLKASDDHGEQARASLLEVAKLTAAAKKR